MGDNYTQDFIDEVKGALNSGSSGGGTIDQTARDDISKHASDSEIHVTTVEKASWNGKAELTDIPTTLPANGGNADTVDGLHASDIQIDSVSNTAELVTLDGLQGGVPFSDITVSSKNHINLTDYTAFPNMIASTAVGGSDSLTVSYSDSIARTWTYIAYKVAVKPNTAYHIKCTAETANGFAGLSVLQSDLSSFSPSVYKWGGNKFSLSFNSGNNDQVFIRFYSNASHTAMTESSVSYHNIMLSEDENAEYVPEIIGQEITLTASEKNLIPYPYSRSNGIYNGITIDISDDGKFSASGVATAGFTLIAFANQDKPIKLVAGRTYTISCSKPYDINNFNLYFRIYHTDGTYSGVTSYPTTFIAKDGDYITGSLWVDEGTSFNVSNVSIQIELGDTTTEYEPYHGVQYTIAPDSNPYTVPNNIRQQDGINNVSVSAGEVSVTGVKKSPVINKAWEELDSHTNNTTVHVTAEEKAAWNGKFDYIGVVHDLFAVDKTCVCAYDMNTLNTPFSSGLTLSGAGLCFVNYVAGAEYATYLVISSGDTNHYAATSNNGSEHVKWHKISDGGNADTINGKRINCNIYTHPVQFGITEADTADDIWKALPDSSIFMAGQSLFTDTSWSFPSGTATFTLVMIKLTAQRTGGIYLYPKNTTGNIYHAVLDNDGNFKAVWYKINDGGDAATLGSHPASDFVLKSDYDALAARVAALEARTTE